jgi:HSF-type DNA-binding
MASEVDSEQDFQGSGQRSYPLIEDIDFDMDTTEYEIYKDYVDEAEEEKEQNLIPACSGTDPVSTESNGTSSSEGTGNVLTTVRDDPVRSKYIREPVSFPSRLFDVVEEESGSIIEWRDTGTSFRIVDVASFVTDILFRRFKRTYKVSHWL